MEKQKSFNQKGITLVALVITIILLLILAGITISQLTGSGLFENAKLAEEKSKNAQEKEEGVLSDYENTLEGYINNNRETVTIDKEAYEKLIGSIEPRLTALENNVEVQNTSLSSSYGITLHLAKTGNVKEIRSAGSLTTAWTAGTTYTLGTLPEEYKPLINATPKYGVNVGNGAGEIEITKDGIIIFRITTSVSASSGVIFTIAYI